MKKNHLLLLALAGFFALLAGWVTTVFTQDAKPSAPTPVVERRLMVFAAASLTDAFRDLGDEFAAQHPGVEVAFNFAGSQQLAYQIGQGAPADVFASANEGQMAAAAAAGRVAAKDVVTFAGNQLIVAVPKHNPGRIHTLADLAKPGIKVVLATEEAPIGRYTQQFLDGIDGSPMFDATFSAQLLANVVSFEQNVRAVLSKVLLGEADAGIVYRSDVTGVYADQLETVPIAKELNVTAAYPIAVTTDAAAPDLAADFVDFVRSPAGQAILSGHGFLTATETGE